MNVKENQGPIRHEAWGEQVTGNNQLNIFTYYADDEMQGFLLWLKNYIFAARREDTILSFTCEDIGVAMVTNKITQLQ